MLAAKYSGCLLIQDLKFKGVLHEKNFLKTLLFFMIFNTMVYE